MLLQELADGATPAPLAVIGSDPALTRQLQTLLGAVGLLDPPVDGNFGPVSQWALAALLKRLDMVKRSVIDSSVATALLGAVESNPFPIQPRSTLAARLVQGMQAKQHWIQRHPECVNIVYVEGMDLDGAPNVDAPNEFNDVRFVLRITPSGLPDILDAWEATTEPGAYYSVMAPLDVQSVVDRCSQCQEEERTRSAHTDHAHYRAS